LTSSPTTHANNVIVISLFAGVFFTHGIELIRPLEYAGSSENVDQITLDFTRLVLGVQLVLAGVQLPSRYLQTHWRPLAVLLGPGMIGMWICTSLLVWLLAPTWAFLPALVIGACVTPTDPVLSNTILKGKFADEHIPEDLRNIIVAESGANDGLGYAFLFLALYLLKVLGAVGSESLGWAGLPGALGTWLGETCLYMILFSVLYGWVIGWCAKEALHWAEKNKFVEKESFFVFAIAMALFIVGTCGMIGTDDVLACFVAGNAFTWDDWFRVETQDDTLQPTIDNLLNASIFMWLGAICPWASFVDGSIMSAWRLFLLGVLVLLLRRLPTILILRRWIPEFSDFKQSIFVGYFGPIGVSAMFYLFVTLEFFDNLGDDEDTIAHAATLKDMARVIIWFLTICSIVSGSYLLVFGSLSSSLLTVGLSPGCPRP
jgi:NhaP-type Na+/H+ or K+/H+ antiporter